MSGAGPLYHRVIIVLFAVGIVLIGSQELRRRHAGKGSKNLGHEMVQAIHGNFDVKAANIAGRSQEQRDRARLNDIAADEDGKTPIKKLVETLVP